MNCCPKCKGTTGFEFAMVVHNLMMGQWDTPLHEYVDSGKTTVSLFECIDCGAKMHEKTVIANRDEQEQPK